MEQRSDGERSSLHTKQRGQISCCKSSTAPDQTRHGRGPKMTAAQRTFIGRAGPRTSSFGPPVFHPNISPCNIHSFALCWKLFSTAFFPAVLTSSSCAGVPVLHPIAPTTTPSNNIGRPPPIVLNLPPLVWLIP